MSVPEMFKDFCEEALAAIQEIPLENFKLTRVNQEQGMMGEIEVEAHFVAHSDYGTFEISVKKYGDFGIRREKPKKKEKKVKEETVNILDELQKL